jgi:DNA repair protein RecO
MDFKENDSILTFLTPEAGKIAGVLHGGKSARSGNSAKKELFVTNHLEFSIKTGAELVRIRKCELLVSHAQIRQNYSKFLHASYLCELLLFCEIPVVESPDYFNLLKRTISKLSEFDNSAEIKLNFEVQLLKLLGISPSLNSCTVCEKFLWTPNSGELRSSKFSTTLQLDAIQGGIRCPDCSINSNYTADLHPGSISFLHYKLSVRDNRVKIKPTRNNLKELDQALNLYFIHFFGKNLKSYSLLKDNS